MERPEVPRQSAVKHAGGFAGEVLSPRVPAATLDRVTHPEESAVGTGRTPSASWQASQAVDLQEPGDDAATLFWVRILWLRSLLTMPDRA